jgi:5-methylcytosine-specific restriction endonuclease McrA
MTNILNKATVLVLNRNWQAINVRTPQEAFCMMATNVATALEIEFEGQSDTTDDVLPLPVGRGEGQGEGSASSRDAQHSTLDTPSIRPVSWDEWITLPVRDHDQAVHTVRGQIRVPTVIVAVNFARVPKKRPKLSAKTIRERDDNRCQYTGVLLRPDEGSLDHVLPRSRGGKDTWENLVWSSKDVNARKADRLPHEAGLKLLKTPRAPRELPASAFIRNAHNVADWHLFVKE